MNRRSALTLLAAAYATRPSFAANRRLSPEELNQMLTSGKNLFYLDVREPKELEEIGTVKGYVNIPLGQLESRLSEIPKSKVVVTMCNRAARAGKAADLLIRNGYQVAGACALFDYRDKKYPMIHPKAAK